MFDRKKIEEIIVATLAADSYSLGSHWVYDEKQLKELPIDWDSLNAPQALYHKGKVAGDFTHIGDQAFLAYEFLKDKKSFDEDAYLKFWEEKMSSYTGYVDGATRETLANLKQGEKVGSNSDDFSVIARISSLLLVSKDEDDFVNNVSAFVKLSHNSKEVIAAATFFARLLFRVKEGQNIEEAMRALSNDFTSFVKESVENGITSKSEDTFAAIRKFGPACGVDGGLPGIVHLLSKYPTNLKELLVQNAKAGGDTSSRAMVATMIIVANSSSDAIPKSWFATNK